MPVPHRKKIEITTQDFRKLTQGAYCKFLKEKDERKRVNYAAILFMCATGCRPREAVIAVFNHKVKKGRKDTEYGGLCHY